MQREQEEEGWQFGVKQSVSSNVSLHVCVDSSSSNLKKPRVCVCASTAPTAFRVATLMSDPLWLLQSIKLFI